MIKWQNIILGVLTGILSILMLTKCVEPLDVLTEIQDEKGELVVEALFTDEVKIQEVFLSRSIVGFDLEADPIKNPLNPLAQLGRDSVAYESRASVKLVGNNGTEFGFYETSDGTYRSNQTFGLQMGVEYVLQISTSNGGEYESEIVKIAGSSLIERIYAERITSDLGVEGVAIFLDSDPIQGAPSHYRYTYDETYKIIAPFWSPNDFKLTNYDPCGLPYPTYNLEIVPREVQNQVCFKTVASNTIDQISTVGNAKAGVERFMVRFISKDDFIITHRYSIEVSQHVQSVEAFTFYKTLKEFSEADNLFSQIQPGALTANVHRTNGSSENVWGQVEAVSLAKQRLFFNYRDFFPNDDLPEYPFGCGEHSSPESHRSYCASGPDGGNPCPESTIEKIARGAISYTGLNDEEIGTCPGPYKYVERICGDCTVLGSNVRPDFWED